MLNVNQVRKSYGSFEAVKGVSFDIKPGEILGFLGPNGAGKTTTIKMCCGLLNPDSGTISINHHPITIEPVEAKRNLGYVPDEPFLYMDLTGRQFIDFIGEIYGVEPHKRVERMEHYLSLLEMSDKGNELISSYSRGMKRKIALIAGIIHEPKVLLLDEPTLGLDAMSAKKSKDIIKDLARKENTAILLTTHVMEIAEQICDKIAVISDGKIIACGTLDELRGQSQESGTLEDVFVKLAQQDIGEAHESVENTL